VNNNKYIHIMMMQVIAFVEVDACCFSEL